MPKPHERVPGQKSEMHSGRHVQAHLRLPPMDNTNTDLSAKQHSDSASARHCWPGNILGTRVKWSSINIAMHCEKLSTVHCEKV